MQKRRRKQQQREGGAVISEHAGQEPDQGNVKRPVKGDIFRILQKGVVSEQRGMIAGRGERRDIGRVAAQQGEFPEMSPDPSQRKSRGDKKEQDQKRQINGRSTPTSFSHAAILEESPGLVNQAPPPCSAASLLSGSRRGGFIGGVASRLGGDEGRRSPPPGRPPLENRGGAASAPLKRRKQRLFRRPGSGSSARSRDRDRLRLRRAAARA